MRLFICIALVLGAATWVGGAHGAVINGTAADDYLVGTNGADTMYGKGGKDELHAKAGNDLLNGGGGNDLLDAGAGTDYLIGAKGNDVLYAWGSTSGKDHVSCGPGSNDWAYVGPLDTVTASCEHVQVLG